MKKVLFSIMMALATTAGFAQGAKSLKFNEILVTNTGSILDEYGCRSAWIEFHNDAFASANARNCFLTTNRAVLNEELSAPERIKMMYQIPSGDVATGIHGKQKMLFFADNMPKRGIFHTSFTLADSTENWIALYDANGTTLLDSVTVPALGENQSWARAKDGVGEWRIVTADNVTPAATNIVEQGEGKVAKFKRMDSLGLGMTVMCMAVVFSALAILWFLFAIIGKIFANTVSSTKKAPAKAVAPAPKKEEHMLRKGGKADEEMAAICMALHEHFGNVHDEESDVLTIDGGESSWHMLTHTHSHPYPYN
ncbi:MAG: OadG family protein [Bacteroidaceae bacterium]|nr:OadG family protein [Bacteroidaceae bacterium]